MTLLANCAIRYISERHTCESVCDGDWIIHRCPKCDYELRDNWKTGEIKVFNSKSDINHSGYYAPQCATIEPGVDLKDEKGS
jgi:hypothetical protein